MEGLEVGVILEKSFELLEEYNVAESISDRNTIIQQHLEKLQKLKATVVPDFENGWEWFNTSQSLSMQKDLLGKVVVLDFFTYCCINCMHILPDLHALEHEYKDTDGVVVLGVHSAKFENEKLSSNILSAILRYDITHPVVNDANAKLWHQLQIQCWPTLVFVGPKNQILFILMGEGHRDLILQFTNVARDYFKSQGQLNLSPIPLKLKKDYLLSSPLLFPGKICPNESGEQLAISDTGHHRILIVNKEGIVQFSIGGNMPGYQDGSLSSAKFHAPQGLAWCGTNIFVADTENHAIRKVDLDKKDVVTVVGTGEQGTDKEGGNPGEKQPISSPWDVCLGSSVGSENKDVLFIAMAGTHQIWMYFLKDGKWLKNNDYKKGTCIRLAGSGLEENRNNNYPHRAGFAQPSGISLGRMTPGGPPCLFIADSESSSVRSVSLTDGAVKAVCGAAKDPTNLFAYGDEDGKGTDAKLQHPLGVTMQSTDGGPLLVADSYNHKIKSVNLETKECRTLLGTGHPGKSMGPNVSSWQLNEPGGLAMHPCEKILYIADTNNNCVKIFDMEKNSFSQLPIIFREDIESVDEVDSMDDVKSLGDVPNGPVSFVPKFKRITPASAKVIKLGLMTLPPGGNLLLEMRLEMEKDQKLNEGAPSAWQIFQDEKTPCYLLGHIKTKDKFLSLADQPYFEINIPKYVEGDLQTDVKVEVMLYHCDNEGLCRMSAVVFNVPIKITSTKSGLYTHQICQLQHKISAL